MTDVHVALQALSQAARLEEEGLAFYREAARRIADERAERTLLSLADDERRHLEMVRRQLHALEGEGRYVLLPDLTVPPIDLEQRIFPPEREAADARLGEDPGELDILHVALENEIRSYDLYRRAAREAGDAAGERMYRFLAGAELTHFNLLMANYESITQAAGWV